MTCFLSLILLEEQLPGCCQKAEINLFPQDKFGNLYPDVSRGTVCALASGKICVAQDHAFVLGMCQTRQDSAQPCRVASSA